MEWQNPHPQDAWINRFYFGSKNGNAHRHFCRVRSFFDTETAVEKMQGLCYTVFRPRAAKRYVHRRQAGTWEKRQPPVPGGGNGNGKTG